MIKSKFNIISQNIIFNTKTFAKLKLDDQHLKNFKLGLIYKFNENEIKILYENGFLVDSNEIELEEIITKLKIREENELRLIIFPTIDCNFRCLYCYEEKKHINLDLEYYSKIIDLIDNFKGNNIFISWFGGEPSLKSKEIISFLKLVNDKCSEKKKNLISSMTTNFSMIDLKTLTNFVNSGIKYYQVTLDGTKEIHDKYRPLLNGLGSFDRVYNNLLEALNSNLDFEITIRLNFDNKTDYLDFFKMMIPFSKDNRFSFELHPICNFDNIERDYTCTNVEAKEREKEIISIMNSLNIKYNENSIFSKYMPCYACMKNNYIIDECGNIKKCTIHLNDERNNLGNLDNFEKIDDSNWINYKFKECQECEVFPLCLGKMCKYDKLDTFEKCRAERVEEIEQEIK